MCISIKGVFHHKEHVSGTLSRSWGSNFSSWLRCQLLRVIACCAAGNSCLERGKYGLTSCKGILISERDSETQTLDWQIQKLITIPPLFHLFTFHIVHSFSFFLMLRRWCSKCYKDLKFIFHLLLLLNSFFCTSPSFSREVKVVPGFDYLWTIPRLCGRSF